MPRSGKPHYKVQTQEAVINKPVRLLPFWVLAAMLLTFLTAGRTAQAATNSWISPVSGSWSQASNWSLGRVPISTDTVYISVVGTADYTVTLNVNATVNVLNLGARSASSRQILQANPETTLNVAGGFTINPMGRFVQRGTLTGSNVAVLGTLAWQSGTQTGTGTTSIKVGGALDLTGAGISRDRFLARPIINNGLIYWGAGSNGSIDITMGGTATINNAYNGLIYILGTGEIRWAEAGSSLQIVNSGVLTKATATGRIRLTGVRYVSSGTTNIQAGLLELNAGGSTSRSTSTTAANVVFQVASGARLDFGDNFDVNGITDITGPGLARINKGIFNVATALTAQNLELYGGTLTGSSALRATSLLTWNGGTMTGAGTTSVDTGAALNVTGAAAKTLAGRAVYNSGAASWTGTGQIILSSGSFVNTRSGTFNATNDAVLTGKGTEAGTFVNEGVFRKTVGTGSTTIVNVSFQNSNMVRAESGVLNVGANYQQNSGRTVLAGGSFAALDIRGVRKTMTIGGGSVNGTGQINANVSNSGSMQPGNSPGTIEILGNYVQTPLGVLDMEIAGTTPGTQCDSLEVSGLATLAGTFNAILYNGYVPPDNTSFELITAVAGVTGKFSTTTGMSLGNGRTFTPVYAGDFFGLGTTVDTTAPVVTVTSPVANQTYPSAANLQLTSVSGTSSDAGGIGAVSVELARYPTSAPDAVAKDYYNWSTKTWTTPLSAVHDQVATGTTNWSCTLPTLPVAFYGVRAVARDAAGNLGYSAWTRFTVPSYYSISGKVTNATGTGVKDITITRTGAAPSTNVKTDASGNYTLPYCIAGAYTITPSGGGYSFHPTSAAVSVTNSNAANVVFIALTKPAITGRVVNSLGVGISGVSVARTGGVAATTNASGYYGFSAVPISAAAYTLTPTLANTTFSPVTRSATVSANTVYNVSNLTALFKISGTVVNSSGVAMSGVTVTRTHATIAASNAITDALGAYTFSGVAANATGYTITPSSGTTKFNPANKVIIISNASSLNQNFAALAAPQVLEGAETSGVRISSVSATVADGVPVISITWTGALAASAADTSHYLVQNAGIDQEITSGQLQNGSKLILTLPAGAATIGDKLTLLCSGLTDGTGARLPRQQVVATLK